MRSTLTHLPAAAPASRHSHFGAWRAAASVPAMIGSLLLLLVMFGWMGRWEGLVLLAWLTSGVAVFTRMGERASVVAGLRRLSRVQAAAVEPVWASALARARVGERDIDLYVRRTGQLNAYAAGRRSIALSSAVLSKFLARRLGSGHLEAILLHDLFTAPVTAVPEMPAA